MREVGFNEQQPVYGYNQNSQYSNGYHSGNAGYSFHPPLIQASNHSQGMDGYQSRQSHYGPPAQYGGYPNNHYGYHGNNQSYGNYSQNSGQEDKSSIPAYVNYNGHQLPVVMLSSPSQSQGEQNDANQGYGSQQSSKNTGSNSPQTVTYTQQWTFPPGAEIPDNLPGYPATAPSTASAGSGTGQSTYPATTNSGTGTGQSTYPTTTNSGNGTGQSTYPTMTNSGSGTSQSGYPTTSTGTPTASNSGGTAASSIVALYGMLNSFSQYLSQAMTTLSSMMSGQQGLQTSSGTGGLITGSTTGTGTGTTGQGGYTSLGGGQQSQTENIQQLQTMLTQAIEEYQSTGDSTALQAIIADANNEASSQSSTGANSQQQQQVQQLLALIQQAQSASSSGSQSPTYAQQQTSLSTNGVTGGTGGVDLGSFLSSLAQMSNPGTNILNATPVPSTTTSSTSQPNSFNKMLANNIYQYYQNDDS
jgi:hypothetical protein